MRSSYRSVLSSLLLLTAFTGMSSVAWSAETETPGPEHARKAKQGLELFRTRVRQILTEKCLDCHGGKSTKADFDLSTRELLMDSGFVDKTADDSHLIALITHQAEPFMPLKADRLSDESIAVIRQWIDLGAPYDKPLVDRPGAEPAAMQVTDADREFWSFQPLNRDVEVPPVQNEKWARTPIDRFILARQEAAGLTPNAVADRRTLIRRGYLDLIGLPPTPEDIDAFVNDPRPLDVAWPEVVDRLLASKHFGERQARHWMDVARFAESFGYEQDYNRNNAYHYRDYLIRAFNDDIAWKQMIEEQLAGDLGRQHPQTQRADAWLATGFMVGGAFPTQLTEEEFESARYDELDDMASTTGVAFLGLSVGCARCHDHKYDPIPTADYYRLAAMFTRVVRSEIDLDLMSDADRDALNRRRAEWQAALTAAEKQHEQWQNDVLAPRFREWLASGGDIGSRSAWQQLKIVSTKTHAGTEFKLQSDGSWLAMGNTPARDEFTFFAEVHGGGLRAIRVETLADDSLPRRGPGRADNGNFALGNFQVSVVTEGQPEGTPIILAKARATHQQNDSSLSVAASIDDDPVSGWAVDGQIGKDQAAVFETAEAFGTENARLIIAIKLTFNHPNGKHAAGRLRFSVSTDANAEPMVGSPGPSADVIAAVATLKQKIDTGSPAWKTALDWFATTDAEAVQQQAELAKKRQAPPEPTLVKAMVGGEGLPKIPHHADGRGYPHFYPETHYLKRGSVHQKGDVAQPGVLQVLHRGATPEVSDTQDSVGDSTEQPADRTVLTAWLTSPDGAGPLALRVMANRIWQHHFGRGIVSTPSDFGFTGERPTHPELLEWLAVQMDQDGWKMKRLHKLIMTSSVYLQDGAFDEPRANIDRENLLLWRRAPLRLEGEAIRDSMLAVSGELDNTMFGPGTLDAGMKRRSVYFFIKRSDLIPMMMLFDWPEHLVSIGERSRTTIAPQALMFMNSPQGRQYAVAFARTLPPGDLSAAIQTAYRRALGRFPTGQELELLTAWLAQQKEKHDSTSPQQAEMLALADLCQAVFSMNEFVYVD